MVNIGLTWEKNKRQLTILITIKWYPIFDVIIERGQGWNKEEKKRERQVKGKKEREWESKKEIEERKKQ